MSATHQKVTSSHLSRDAYMYVRQSSLRHASTLPTGDQRRYYSLLMIIEMNAAPYHGECT